VQLTFVPVEEFYFALTLAVRTLDEIERPGLIEAVKDKLWERYGQPSTVAAASQNTFNYVFQVQDYDTSSATPLIVSIADWQGKLRLSSDYGWILDEARKPVRTDQFPQRTVFSQHLQQHLQHDLNLSWPLSDG
jgi:outer membrane protein assembly factor BamE (lipoprotein component of BamABCDE complex)